MNIDNAIVIKETEFNKYGFLPLTLEEYDAINIDIELYHSGKIKDKDFKEKHNISINDMLLHGDVSEVSSDLISNYIDVATVKESDIQPLRTSYKCFCGTKYGINHNKTIAHGSVIDSWKCLLVHTGLPRYGVIINLKPYEKTI